MSKQSILEHLGQYSVLVFQNDGADTLVKYLQEQCFNAWTVDEENALSEIAKDNIDVAVLDYYHKYDKPNDLTLVHTMQKYYPDVPIILCVENDDPLAAIAAYEAGVSDFVRKPYNTEEFVWRLRTWTKHAPLRFLQFKKEYVIHNMVLNTEDHTFFDGHKTIELTDKEFAIMTYLFSSPNQLLMTQVILSAVWHQIDVFAKRSLDFYMTAIRKYIAADPKVKIVTVYGKGYVFRVEK